MIDVADIISGITEEIRQTRDYVEFHVTVSQRDGAIWKVGIEESDRNRNELDESLEGARVWWPGPPNGTAEVLSVIPEDSLINLRFANRPPPAAGKSIRVYLPKYLEKLLDIWLDDRWSAKCAKWLHELENENPKHPGRSLGYREFNWLRSAQKSAFDLPANTISFLHGPPGTGKTRTLGAIIAKYLCQFPSERVLLLSTTNVAVDEALVSVDNALRLTNGLPNADRIRLEACKRIGSHFVAGNYSDRKHLLPRQDTELLEQLVRLEAEKPPVENVAAYAGWKRDVENLRSQMREAAESILIKSRLVAMTTTRAVWDFASIRRLFQADLVVFDESSQVGLAHALAIAPLAKRSMFTGDPKQLAPIAKSGVSEAQEWLGQSMFARQDAFKDATCFLDEQSRMAEPICQVVSKAFYDGRLKVAAECNKTWFAERNIAGSKTASKAVSIERVPKDANFSAKYGGHIRYDSAIKLVELVSKLVHEVDKGEILILTPFRAQRRLIKAMLKKDGIRSVTVSTVHRAQGSERHTVIFDPVDGRNNFLNTEDAPRLINVALSRAKARLVLLMSDGDMANPVLAKIETLINNVDGLMQFGAPGIDKPTRARHVREILKPEFPQKSVGREISITGKAGIIIGRIKSVSQDGSEFELLDYKTGATRKFKTKDVRNNARG